jgi:hypothetical protein
LKEGRAISSFLLPVDLQACAVVCTSYIQNITTISDTANNCKNMSKNLFLGILEQKIEKCN